MASSPCLSFRRRDAVSKSVVVSCFKAIAKLGLPWSGAPKKETGHNGLNLQRKKIIPHQMRATMVKFAEVATSFVNREARGLVMA